jgi:hypothetical protein
LVNLFGPRVPRPARFEFGPLGVALLSLLCIVFGGPSSGLSATDVFADDASVDALGSGVVPSALVPAHFCYTSTNAPLGT